MTRTVVSGGGGGGGSTAPAPGNNIFSGTFGNGSIMTFGVSGTFVVPSGVTSIRIRLWGGGGGGASQSLTGGGGGGFAIKTLSVTSGTSYAVTVGEGGLRGTTGGTSSFGSDVSATGGGGANNNNVGQHDGGTGTGGDINATGGFGSTAHRVPTNGSGYTGGGGAASLLGDGNDGVSANQGYMDKAVTRGGAGGGIGRSSTPNSSNWGQAYGTLGYNGFNTGGGSASTSNDMSCFTSIFSQPVTSIDMIGTGPGGWHGNPGHNGGGGSGPCGQAGGGCGGFPGGGGGCYLDSEQMATGAQGLVIVEY